MRAIVRSTRLTLAALLLLGCMSPLCAEPLAGVADHVADGDTLTLQLKNGKRETVRLQGMDAPEPKQAHDEEATAEPEAPVLLKPIRIISLGRASALRETRQTARAARKGLWQAIKPQETWLFRNVH